MTMGGSCPTGKLPRFMRAFVSELLSVVSSTRSGFFSRRDQKNVHPCLGLFQRVSLLEGPPASLTKMRWITLFFEPWLEQHNYPLGVFYARFELLPA